MTLRCLICSILLTTNWAFYALRTFVIPAAVHIFGLPRLPVSIEIYEIRGMTVCQSYGLIACNASYACKAEQSKTLSQQLIRSSEDKNKNIHTVVLCSLTFGSNRFKYDNKQKTWNWWKLCNRLTVQIVNRSIRDQSWLLCTHLSKISYFFLQIRGKFSRFLLRSVMSSEEVAFKSANIWGMRTSYFCEKETFW